MTRSRCPRGLRQYPTSPCQMGKNEIYLLGDRCDRCPWGVKEEASNHCMWVWLRRHPGKHTVMEVADELDITAQRITQICKKAYNKLKSQDFDLKLLQNLE